MQKELIDKELTDADAIGALRQEVKRIIERGRKRYGLTQDQFIERYVRVNRATGYRMLQPGKKIQFPLLMTLAYAVELEQGEIDALVAYYDNAQREYDALARCGSLETTTN